MPSSGFVDRIASTDPSYKTGDLSIFPRAKDDASQLYVVANNATTQTSQSISYNLPYIVVDDASNFPPFGIIRVGTEAVYYAARTDHKFYNLKRGFAGSRQNPWPIGTPVSAAVMAEPHNAIKDALINIEKDLGLEINPDPASLNGILKSLEARFLAPRPLFRAASRSGAAPLTVKFQNFTVGDGATRYFWDFGDGATSIDIAPTHTYQASGKYTVKLDMVTSLGARGIVTKTNYIEVSDDDRPQFFYVTPATGPTSTVFDFVDQSEGPITSRFWIWGDGTSTEVDDPDIHSATHQYSLPGTYLPTLMLVFNDNKTKIVRLEGGVVVV